MAAALEPEPFGDDELYFGSCRVHLAPVPGEVVPFNAGRYAVDFSDEALQRTLARSRRMYVSASRQSPFTLFVLQGCA